ncbi:MAG TPA: helix-turn-helix transcriptional regulator [Pantanalinema sp.]
MQSGVLPSAKREGRAITYWRKQTERERSELASRLRQARQEAQLGQREVAKRLGIPQSIVSELENGQRKIDVAELKCLAAMYSKPPGWFLSDLPRGLCEQSPMEAGLDLLRLASVADATRKFNRTTLLRQEDVEGLETVAFLSNISSAKVMWLGDVHLLHSTVLIPLVFRSGTMKQELLAALQRQSTQPSKAASMEADGMLVAEVVEVRIEHCQAQGDYLKFGGWMILRLDSPTQVPLTDRKFEARMSRTRDIEITWLEEALQPSRSNSRRSGKKGQLKPEE